MKKYNQTKKIISIRLYDFKSISKILNVHIRTVQKWRKFGLKVIDVDAHKYLVEGKDLKQFLHTNYCKEKVKLREDEFYCLKCRKGCHSLPDKITKVETYKKIGLNAYQVIYQGVCEFCGSKVNRYSTDKKILFRNTECQEGMVGIYEHNLNADIMNDSLVDKNKE